MENIKYDLILQNNGSKQEFLYMGIVPSEESTATFYKFDIDLDVPSGEYTYCLIMDMRDDVVYVLNDVILNSVVETSEGNVLVRNLNPMTGLLIVNPQDREDKKIYIKKNKDYIFYKK